MCEDVRVEMGGCWISAKRDAILNVCGTAGLASPRNSLTSCRKIMKKTCVTGIQQENRRQCLISEPRLLYTSFSICPALSRRCGEGKFHANLVHSRGLSVYGHTHGYFLQSVLVDPSSLRQRLLLMKTRAPLHERVGGSAVSLYQLSQRHNFPL